MNFAQVIRIVFVAVLTAILIGSFWIGNKPKANTAENARAYAGKLVLGGTIVNERKLDSGWNFIYLREDKCVGVELSWGPLRGFRLVKMHDLGTEDDFYRVSNKMSVTPIIGTSEEMGR